MAAHGRSSDHDDKKRARAWLAAALGLPAVCTCRKQLASHASFFKVSLCIPSWSATCSTRSVKIEHSQSGSSHSLLFTLLGTSVQFPPATRKPIGNKHNISEDEGCKPRRGRGHLGGVLVLVCCVCHHQQARSTRCASLLSGTQRSHQAEGQRTTKARGALCVEPSQ